MSCVTMSFATGLVLVLFLGKHRSLQLTAAQPWLLSPQPLFETEVVLYSSRLLKRHVQILEAHDCDSPLVKFDVLVATACFFRHTPSTNRTEDRCTPRPLQHRVAASPTGAISPGAAACLAGPTYGFGRRGHGGRRACRGKWSKRPGHPLPDQIVLSCSFFLFFLWP